MSGRRLALAALLAACHHGAATATAAPAESGVENAKDGGAPDPPRDPRVDELWDRASEGELGDLARLRDREGDLGLIERARVPAYRMTALAALACGEDFTALPFLAEVASSGADGEAEAALAGAASLAARPRRTRDPEDALELRQGCEGLLALARTVEAPRGRRAAAISVLRMLEPTGCLHGEAPPTDLDPK